MKKLEIITRPEKLEILKQILDEKTGGLNIVNIMGYGNQNGTVKGANGKEYQIGMLPKIKVETIVSDDRYEQLIDELVAELNTGNHGDGKIAVYDVVDYVRIRTGEHGDAAL